MPDEEPNLASRPEGAHEPRLHQAEVEDVDFAGQLPVEHCS